MHPDFIRHIQNLWPLAVITAGLAVYLLVVLLGGTFFTNQGPIARSDQPARYWRWVRGFLALFLACGAVLIGSFLLDPQR